MSAILTCTNVNKSYGKNNAVRNLDLKLEENTIYGLLGPNGAGKTTLLNMITGGVFRDSGEIEIAGSRLEAGDTPANICYVREKNLFFGGAKVSEIFELASAFHINWDWTITNELVKTFKLNPDKKIKQLSRGMESLVGNIIGLASRAPLTIFDEPVLGLDVLMREKFYRFLMADYAENPRTILLSTHLIDEIAKLVEQIYIIDAGSILLHDNVENIRTNSHLMKGSSEAISKFTNGRNVIYQESYGNGTLAAVYDKIGKEDRMSATKQGISIDGLPLQKFFAYLLERGEHVE